MIKEAVDVMEKSLAGEEIEKDYIIPVSVVDAENVNDFQGFGNYEEKAE